MENKQEKLAADFSPEEDGAREEASAPEPLVETPESDPPLATLADLPEKLAAACARAGWSQLTPVQALAIPWMLSGRDVTVQSRTGSGKTGCYLLPMLELLKPHLKKPQALVLAPTRELAAQIEREAETLFADSGIVPCAIYGGASFKKQIAELVGGAQVIIGTPGRIIDHLLRQTLRLDGLAELVFDEADRMLSIGFYPDMAAIARHLPRERHTSMFSATYPPQVLRLANEFMTDPGTLSLSRDATHVVEVEHLFCEVKPMDKDRALIRLLETENPSQAIIFCNTKAEVHYLASALKGFGYRAEELSADLTQKKREATLKRVRDGEIKYLVATDVAARGIDIPDLSHVFLCQPPEDKEDYIHRAGRTGRAGAAGTVISLVDVMQRLDLERLGRAYHIDFREIPAPTDEDVAKAVSMRLVTMLESRLRSLTGLEKMRAARYLPLARELAAQAAGACGGAESGGAEFEAWGQETALDIIAMLLDDCHRSGLNETRLPAAIPRPQASRAGGNGGRRRSRRRK